jgi:hypothetical protein
MDEAIRCDRVALMQLGRVLDVDRPAVISERYPLPLLAVSGAQRYKMLAALRGYEHAHAVYPFGETIHYTDARADARPEDLAAELRDFLRGKGFGDADVRPIAADIEDAFMNLMESRGPLGESPHG